MYIDHVYAYHGLSEKMVSDRGPQFRSAFNQSLAKVLVSLKPLFMPNSLQFDCPSIRQSGLESHQRKSKQPVAIVARTFHEGLWVLGTLVTLNMLHVRTGVKGLNVPECTCAVSSSFGITMSQVVRLQHHGTVLPVKFVE